MPASTRTRLQFAQDVQQLLNEPTTSTIPALPAGTGTNAYTITAADGINALVNQAKDRICRYGLLVPGDGAKTVAVGEGPTFLYTTLTFSGTKTIRAAHTVSFDPTGTGAGQGPYTLTKIAQPNMDAWYLNRNNQANAAPLYWANTDSRTAITLQAKTSLGGVLMAGCYIIPVDLATDMATFDWLNSDDEPAVAYETAILLCEKRADDPRLQTILPGLVAERNQIIVGMRERVSKALRTRYLESFAPMRTGEAP